MNELDTLVDTARAAFAQAAAPADLENAKAQFLGKSGRITELMKGMAALSRRREEVARRRHQRGQAGHRGRADRAPPGSWPTRSSASSCSAEALDVTLPGRRARRAACTR